MIGELYYDPWDLKCKEPFGAIKERDFCRFTLTASDEAVVGVNLVIGLENHEIYKIPMESNGTDQYSYEYFFNDGKGLYFYHFEIIYWNQYHAEYIRYFCPSEKGGVGELVDRLEDLRRFQVTCYAKEETAPEWYQEAVFYQIFPDRFFNGNPDGKVNCPKPNTFLYGTEDDEPMYIKDAEGEVVRWDFYGGNFAGIKAKIPYLLELGINAIYLNPIFQAHSNHRYDTGDYLKIDPILGTEAEFRDLVKSLHEAGIRLILDGVFSHVGRNSIYFNYDGTYGEHSGAYRDLNSPYFPWFTFKDYPNDYKAWWGVLDLPEVDKHNRDFQEFIFGQEGVLSKWNSFGVDGWRLDVADELPDEFIQGIRHNLDGFPDKMLIGEVWEDASNKISYDVRRQYILGDHLMGVMNYPLRNTVLDLLLNGHSPEDLAYSYTKLQENYPREVFYNSFNNIGTHDTERILTMLGEDRRLLQLAFGMLFMFPGVPVVYYGDEAGSTGGKDPDNRKFFPWDRGDQAIYQMCHQWIQLRRNHKVLQTGEFRLVYTEKLFGVLRYDEENWLLAVFNPTDGMQHLAGDQLLATLPLPLSKEELLAAVPKQIIKEKEHLLFQGKF